MKFKKFLTCPKESYNIKNMNILVIIALLKISPAIFGMAVVILDELGF